MTAVGDGATVVILLQTTTGPPWRGDGARNGGWSSRQHESAKQPAAAAAACIGRAWRYADSGATLLVGSNLRQADTLLYEPPLLTGIADEMALAREEIFGPVVGIGTFEDEAAVLARANDSVSGLAAYFYTANLERAWRAMEGLEYGIAGVATGAVSNEVGPFGGIKESGVDREGSKYRIEEFLEIKYVCLGGKTFGAPR